ncbi:glycoside hydrolase [Amylocystis lapponica]|nr:glycoside hydrolase [Amylocystis lapponica]
MAFSAIRPLLLWFVLYAATLQTAFAAPAFAGSNLYYAAGLNNDQATTLLKGLQSAGMKVLRVWLDGEEHGAQKGTSLNAFHDLEPSRVCNGASNCYDDTVLERLDNFMVMAHSYGIKLLISMHSWNALKAGDVYTKQYGTGYFYEQSGAMNAFDQRLIHVLNHQHSSLGKPWKELKDYIFAFEAQNEAMIGKGESYVQNHASWQCGRATTIKNQLGDNSGILVTTGGESWLSESVQEAFLDCPALDIISIHAYGPGDLTVNALKPYVQKAQNKGKKLLLEEWGACYFNTGNNDCPTGGKLDTNTRNNNIKNWAAAIAEAGIPWLYWQVIPNGDPHSGFDYEVGLNDASWGTLKQAALDTAKANSAFDFSEYLL